MFLQLSLFIVVICTPPSIKGDMNCSDITQYSPWEYQLPIHDCHYSTHVHPRQIPRNNRTKTETEEFHHLAIFNIRYGLDFQEAGDPCSVRLQEEWLLMGGGPSSSSVPVPVPLSEYSFNRIWYKRLCSFFSFLECIPIGQKRVKSEEDWEHITRKRLKIRTNNHEHHKHAGALPDGHNHLPSDIESPEAQFQSLRMLASGKHEPYKFNTALTFNDSGRSTIGMYRMKISGRGPGKGRQRSGPGTSRVDPSKLLGLQSAIPSKEYPLDGICVCSYRDPEFPDRKRPDYGMDFVEDEAREDWCVAAPGNLCGRVYFKRNLWPGQNFEFSDHIGCPRSYDGEEYECIRWQKNYKTMNKEEISEGSLTSTCEKKQEDPEFLKLKKEAEKEMAIQRRKRRWRTSGTGIGMAVIKKSKLLSAILLIKFSKLILPFIT